MREFMRHLGRLGLAIAVLGSLSRSPHPARAAQDGVAPLARLSASQQDLQDLYAAFLRERGRPERCEYPTDWMKDDETLVASAHRLWGSGADVVAPSDQVRTDFRRTFDPRDKSASAFCTSDEDGKYISRRIQDSSDDADWELRFNRVRTTLPIFNETYDKALFIEVHETFLYKHIRGYLV